MPITGYLRLEWYDLKKIIALLNTLTAVTNKILVLKDIHVVSLICLLYGEFSSIILRNTTSSSTVFNIELLR